jgi:hypothetical protein
MKIKAVVLTDKTGWFEFDPELPESLAAAILRDVHNYWPPTSRTQIFGEFIEIDDQRPAPKTIRRLKVDLS